MSISLDSSELGKKSDYLSEYDPTLLFPIPRDGKRQEIGIQATIPFVGIDIWNHYEVSWLNTKGKPMVAVAELIIPCDSDNIIESKSMKLYFNSFNNTQIANLTTLENIIKQDLSTATNSDVNIKVTPLNAIEDTSLTGTCLDSLDIECTKYLVHKEYLATSTEIVSETLCSHLLKSNCLVTKQPDWGSIQIDYQGAKIDHEGLLKYIVSFRNHNEFHEQCIERVFVDIMQMCKPKELNIYGRYTRRGGLDINVYRGTKPMQPLHNRKMTRQ